MDNGSAGYQVGVSAFQSSNKIHPITAYLGHTSTLGYVYYNSNGTNYTDSVYTYMTAPTAQDIAGFVYGWLDSFSKFFNTSITQNVRKDVTNPNVTPVNVTATNVRTSAETIPVNTNDSGAINPSLTVSGTGSVSVNTTSFFKKWWWLILGGGYLLFRYRKKILK